MNTFREEKEEKTICLSITTLYIYIYFYLLICCPNKYQNTITIVTSAQDKFEKLKV